MERAYAFGKDGCLVGILSEPDARQTKRAPGVVLWNSGLVHRVGPFRLYVDLARKLASMGFLVFRFDLSGKGDSEIPKDSLPYQERALSDAQEAMDFISAKRGIEQFVLIGLCSGADEAHSVAVLDSRVTGVVFLDTYGYRTLGFYLRRYGPRLFKLGGWSNILKRIHSGLFAGPGKDGDETEATRKMFERDFPPKAKVRQEIQRLIERGVNLLYIYSGGVKYHYYNYGGQFKDMFKPLDFKGRIQATYFAKAEHTYPLLADRHKLITCICHWVKCHFDGCDL